MFSGPRAPKGIVEIALGAVDGNIPVEPDAHIYVASGASWVTPCDGLPCYAEGRDGALAAR